MKAQLRKLWESRAPRERTTIMVMTAILAVALYSWLVQAGGHNYTYLRERVAALRVQAGELEQQAAELKRLRATPVKTVSQTDLRTLVQSQADSAGLASALVKIDAADANQVMVVFNAVAFADWLNWVARLKSQQVRVDTCQIEAQPAPGRVNVTATLLRSSKS
ncbi:MAG: type II secretion system protein M [Sulfuriferula sp.]